jgi:hypothetical protein
LGEQRLKLGLAVRRSFVEDFRGLWYLLDQTNIYEKRYTFMSIRNCSRGGIEVEL